MNLPTITAACGKCCCQLDDELEVKRPGKRIAAPFFQGPLEVADEKDTTSVPQTSAPAVVEEMAQMVESRRSRDHVAPLPAPVPEPLPPPEPPQKRGVDSEPEPPAPKPGTAEPQLSPPSEDSAGATRAEPRRTFRAVIAKGERKLGIDINHHDNFTLLVTKVNDGPVMEHNLARPGDAILPGDRIVELNGVRGNTQYMLASCIGVTELHFAVASGHEWTARLDAARGKAGQHLGIDARPCDVVSLAVHSLDGDGLAAQRLALEPDFDMRTEDRIVAVNGARLDASALLRELETATSWTITWRRMALDEL